MADISPETAAKIHDLEARYEENRGRYFVALASALREAGEVGRAEELLRSGLRHYPGSLSAHIVLGRCLADRGATEEATHEFRYVLSVDPQNLIALRTLGEMSASAGRADEAARWYRELLAVDPMNKEAQSALDGLASAPRAAAPGAAFGAPAPDEPAQPEYGMVELSPEPAPAPAESDFGMVEPAGLDFEITPSPADDDPFSIVAEPAATRPDDFAAPSPAEFGLVELDAPVASSGGDVPLEPVAAVDDGPSDFGAWGEISLDEAPEPAAHEEDTERPGEYDAFSFGDLPPSADDAPPAGEATVPFGGDGDSDDEVEVVTETMAELYARQGFHDRAADVYRELIRRRGEEPGLVARLAEAERRARGQDEPAADPADAWRALADAPYAGEDVVTGDSEALPLLETGLPGLGLPMDPDFPSYEPEPPVQLGEPVSFGEPLEVASATGPVDAAFGVGTDAEVLPPATPMPTGDAFADSFAHGFVGAPATGELTSEVPPAATPWVEATPSEDAPPFVDEAPFAEPAPELVSGIAEQPYGSDTIGGSHADDPLPIAGTVAPPSAAAPEMPSGDFGIDMADVPPVDVPAEDVTATADEASPVELPAAVAEPASPPVASAPAPTTISGYLSSLLAWRPGMPTGAPVAEAAPAPVVADAFSIDADAPVDFGGSDADSFTVDSDASIDADASMEAGASGDPVGSVEAADVALDLADETVPVAGFEPSFDSFDDTPAVEVPSSTEMPAAEFDIADVTPEVADAGSLTPADEAATDELLAGEEDLPWINTAEPAPSAPAAEDASPWDTPWDAPAAETEPLGIDAFAMDEPADADVPTLDDVVAPAGDEAMYPWEFAASPAPADEAPTPAPVDEAPAAGGFSFEDFFAAPPEPAPAPVAPTPAPAPLPEPLPMPEPAPTPPAAAAPGTPAGGAAADDEEDLESFQAWLQSLKR